MNDIFTLFAYDFFRNAMLAAILISIAGGITGTYIVARRQVFVAGGITHASFGGVGVGHFFGFSPVLGAAMFGLFSALTIEAVSHHQKIRHDNVTGMLWAAGMALGIILVYLTPGYAPNLMSYLFGNILLVKVSDLVALAVLAALIITLFILCYNHILFMAFDQDFARITGTPVKLLSYLLSGVIALTFVLSIKVIGLVLLISFVTIPQATAGLLSQRFGRIMILSTLISIAGSVAGLILSYYAGLPSGASIIVCFIAILILVWVMRVIASSAIRRRIRQGLKQY